MQTVGRSVSRSTKRARSPNIGVVAVVCQSRLARYSQPASQPARHHPTAAQPPFAHRNAPHRNAASARVVCGALRARRMPASSGERVAQRTRFGAVPRIRPQAHAIPVVPVNVVTRARARALAYRLASHCPTTLPTPIPRPPSSSSPPPLSTPPLCPDRAAAAAADTAHRQQQTAAAAQPDRIRTVDGHPSLLSASASRARSPHGPTTNRADYCRQLSFVSAAPPTSISIRCPRPPDPSAEPRQPHCMLRWYFGGLRLFGVCVE